MNTVGSDGAVATAAVGFDTRSVMDKARAENFPVALALLSRQQRKHLQAIYGFARFVDDLGDLSSGDRLAALKWAEDETDRALAGRATHPIFVAAGVMANAVGASRQPLVDLIEANRRDQTVTRYSTFEELLGYCALSANPVGRLVLAVFGVDDAEATARSDDVCTGLQLVEHWQDVAEDYAMGRVYLPEADRQLFSVEEAELCEERASPALRRLLAFECGRARQYLDSGFALARLLTKRPRLAIAGFVGGGLAQLEAIERQSFDVLAAPAKASKPQVARKALAVLARRAA